MSLNGNSGLWLVEYFMHSAKVKSAIRDIRDKQSGIIELQSLQPWTPWILLSWSHCDHHQHLLSFAGKPRKSRQSHGRRVISAFGEALINNTFMHITIPYQLQL